MPCNNLRSLTADATKNFKKSLPRYLVALDQNTTQQLQQSRDDNKDFEVQIERLFAANEDLTKLNNTLREENKRLKAQIAALEDRISALEQAFDDQISLREVARVFESACVLHLFIIICLSVHIIGATVVLITYPEWAAGPDRLKNTYGMFFIFGLVQHTTVFLELKYSIQYDRGGTWEG